MGRPGAMLVQSQPTQGGITNSDLERWYLDKHIPEVLDAGGVRGVLFCQINRESSKNYSGESHPKLYLAVYLLPDLDWLHEESCALWKLSLVLSSDDATLESKHKGRSVFEVAEFTTHFWEVVDPSCDRVLPPQFMAVAPDDGKTAKESTKRLVLSYLESPPHEYSTESRSKLAESDFIPTPPPRQKPTAVTSTLFRVDETRPGPPGIKDEEGDAPPVLSETLYLHCHRLCGHANGPDTPLIEPDTLRSRTVEYTVLAEFGETEGLTIG